MEADCYVEQVPRLATLAGDVISRFPTIIAESVGSCGPGESWTYRLRGDLAALPLPVCEVLLDSFRRNHGRYNILLTPKILGFFLDSTRTPLMNLNLENSFVNDQILARLLAAHGRNLLHVNVSGCSGLTEELNELSKRMVSMNRLRVLNLGSLVKLFAPWLRGPGDLEDVEDSADEEDDDVAPWKALEEEMVKAHTSVLCLQVNGTVGNERDEELMSDEDSEDDAMDMDMTDGRPSRPIPIGMEVTATTSQAVPGSGDGMESLSESSSSPSGDLANSPDGHHKALERSSTITLFSSPPKRRSEDSSSRDGKFIITQSCPDLQALILHGDQLDETFSDMTANIVAEFFLCLLHHTRRLLYLDLSYWSKMNDLRFLRPQRCVQTLILYDVPDLYQASVVICSLTTLRHLDVSQSSRDTGQYPCPVTTLNSFVTSLPNLTSLDISSTNLASNPTKGDFLKQTCNVVESDIVGLRSLQRPLEYLGIFYCDIAAHYHRIPAKKVAGDANESQILLAIEQHMKRPALLLKVLNEAYQVYRFGSPGRYAAALQLMLESMSNHVEDASIQIAASASIFYIIRNVNMTAATKKRVVNALLTGMEEHLNEQTMVRNCCLSLCQFDVPNDLLFDYTRAARLLLRVIEEFQDSMTQRIVVYLLNSMACHVEGEQKVAVGELNAVERILNMIRRRHEAGVCDEVMEVSWSFLWNITDETPANCERFLLNGGMKLFFECYKKYTGNRKLLRNMTGLLKFPDKNELLRNMMGLMGNIAEVKEMRPHLMLGDYVSVFCELLKNLSDGIEISYNSAGVLSHMLSDGLSAWKDVHPSREEATQAVIQAIETWQVDARRFINYRSFEPILRLVPLFDSPASQHWSIWALANLTTVDASKYCTYVVHEGGMPLLELVAISTQTSLKVRELTRSVLMNVQNWASENNVKL